MLQEDAPNALEAVTEPEGEIEEPQPAMDESTPTVRALSLCSTYKGPAWLFLGLASSQYPASEDTRSLAASGAGCGR